MKTKGIKYRLSAPGGHRRLCKACGSELQSGLDRCPVCGGETKRVQHGPRDHAGASTPWHEIAVVATLVLVMGVVAFGSIFLLVKRFVWKSDSPPATVVAPSEEPGPDLPVSPAPVDMPPAPVRTPSALVDMPPHPMGAMPPGLADMMAGAPPRPDLVDPMTIPAAPPPGDLGLGVPPDLEVSGVATEEPRPAPRARPKPIAPGETAFNQGMALLDDARERADDPGRYRDAVDAAIEKLQAAAEADYVPAMRELGALYADAEGPVADSERALVTYRQAGRAGDVESQRAALALVEAGPGDARCPECFEWLQEAADRGNPDALMTLGTWSLEGRHTTKSAERALMLFQRASDRGHPDAPDEVGRLYMSGELGDTDPQGAFPYFMRAGHAGRSAGLEAFIQWCREEMGRRVAEWVPDVVKDEKVSVRKPTGRVVTGTVERVDEYDLAIRKRDGTTVKIPLGQVDMKLRGRVDPAFRDELAAIRTLEYLLQLGATANNPALRNALTAQGLPALETPAAHRAAGLNWVEGVGGDSDLSRGHAWLWFAALQGDAVAQYYVGRNFYEGNGIDQSYDHALAWLDLSAGAGYEAASSFIDRHWRQEETLRQQRIAANKVLERERMEHAQALSRLTEQNSYVTLFQRGKDGLRRGAVSP